MQVYNCYFAFSCCGLTVDHLWRACLSHDGPYQNILRQRHCPSAKGFHSPQIIGGQMGLILNQQGGRDIIGYYAINVLTYQEPPLYNYGF